MRCRRIAMPRWMWARMCCDATALGTISRGPCPEAWACACWLSPEDGVASMVMDGLLGGLNSSGLDSSTVADAVCREADCHECKSLRARRLCRTDPLRNG